MYDDLMKEMREKMQPLVDMADINKAAAEKLFSLQSEYFTDFVNSSMSQVKALTETKDPKELLELQIAYTKSLESKIKTMAEEEASALTEAQTKITELVEKSISEASSADYFSDVSKYINDMTEVASKYMTETVAVTTPAPAPEPTPAPAKAAAPRKAPAKRAAKKPAAAKAAE